MNLISFKDIFKKDFIIGLDIGTASVKLAQFEKRENGFYLVRLDLKEIRPADNEAVREEEITGILNDLLKGIDRNKSQIIVSINCPHTAINRVVVPYMPKQELRECINLGIKNYFMFPVTNSLSDYEILGDFTEKGVKKYEAVLAVSPKATIDKYLSLLAKVGVSPTALIPVPFALQKSAEAVYAKEGKTLCFVDIGALYTELIILKGKNLIFSRKIPVAGNEITRAMTGVLISDRGRIELTLDEAEKIKREIGIPSETEARIINDKVSTTQILSMLRTPLVQLVGEIARCLDYYREESGGERIDFLVLSGGGASLRGLAKFLSEELGMEVRLGNPLEGLKARPDARHEKDGIFHVLAVAIGSALSGGGAINLLPPEVKEKTKRMFKRTTFETTATIVILILAFIYIGMRIKLNNYQKRANVAKLELSSLEPQLKQARVFSLLAGEPYWSDTFKELSNIIPNDIYLTRLSMRNKIITIKGIALQVQGQERISDFMLSLEKGLFNNVKLVSTRGLQKKASKEFVLNCRID
ncbi:MAG: type IV pilus assembly protein PilM [Candidatus Omnitrophota bacterium]|jgi:type IV pilus assembly protein PilM